MIQYHYQTEFRIKDQGKYTDWINAVVHSMDSRVDQLNYIFMTDESLLELNKEYLNHDYFTDIITFPYSEGPDISGDIFISTDRVWENSKDLHLPMEEEMRRVMIHGVLHLIGLRDKTEKESVEMRAAENNALEMFHVER